MLTTAIFPGRYVQGAHALAVLGEECARLGARPLVLEDAYVRDSLHADVESGLGDAADSVVEAFGGECSEREINRLVERAKAGDCDAVVGVGGGKTLDTAKAVAFELNCPVVIVPTIASTDAPCSALSVIYTDDGVFERYLVLPRNPDVVIVDTALVAKAPIDRLVDLAKSRGWHSIRLLSSLSNDFNRDYNAEQSEDVQRPVMSVFTRSAGSIHHFYSTELLFLPPDKGQNHRHIDTMWPLWNVLDLVPEGRGTDWYPSLDYSAAMAEVD